MKKFSVYQIVQINFLNLYRTWPIWTVIGLIAGGILLKLTGDSDISVFGAFFSGVFANFVFSSKKIKETEKHYSILEETIKSSLEQIDYFNVSLHGAIAISTRNNQISIINSNKTMSFNKPITFQIEKIKTYQASSPGYSEWESLGKISTETRIEMQLKNISNQAHAFAATGIYFYLDDIITPEAFAQMAYPDATKWMLIIEKALNKTLQEQPTPLRYPINN